MIGVAQLLNWSSLCLRASVREWVVVIVARSSLSPSPVCLVGTGSRKDREEDHYLRCVKTISRRVAETQRGEQD